MTTAVRVIHRGIPIALVACAMMAAPTARAQWPQWGGPNRDFTVETEGLADAWPEKGPRELWKKRLGEGYSSIVVDDGALYTMYRKGKTAFEYTVALDATTGRQLWETKHPSPVPRTGRDHPGPHSTPLVSGDRLFAIGRNAVLRCYRKNDGEVLWEQDLVNRFGATFSEWGYSPSPIAYDNLVITPVSRRSPKFANHSPSASREAENPTDENAEGRTLMAFDQEDGHVVWKSQDVGIDHSSPILINFEGQAQLVLVTPEAIFAVDPAIGELLWRQDFDRVSGYMVTPLWIDGSYLFFSTPDTGSRVLELTKQGSRTAPVERWQNRQMRLAFANPVRVGDLVVGSSGHPAITTCMNIKSGRRAWVDRSLGGATFLLADGKLIILDVDGHLGLATTTPEGLTVHSRCKITEKESFTAPTLVGTTLYVRDRKHIMALDLS